MTLPYCMGPEFDCLDSDRVRLVNRLRALVRKAYSSKAKRRERADMLALVEELKP